MISSAPWACEAHAWRITATWLLVRMARSVQTGLCHVTVGINCKLSSSWAHAQIQSLLHASSSGINACPSCSHHLLLLRAQMPYLNHGAHPKPIITMPMMVPHADANRVLPAE